MGRSFKDIDRVLYRLRTARGFRLVLRIKKQTMYNNKDSFMHPRIYSLLYPDFPSVYFYLVHVVVVCLPSAIRAVLATSDIPLHMLCI